MDATLTISAVAGALVAVATALRVAVIPIVRWGRRVARAVEYSASEMQRDGGSTIRDSMDRIERLAIENGEAFQSVSDRLDGMDTRLTALEGGVYHVAEVVEHPDELE